MKDKEYWCFPAQSTNLIWIALEPLYMRGSNLIEPALQLH
jgi:hypothetical protein